MNDADRIRLAEIRGYVLTEVDHEYRYCLQWPDGKRDAYVAEEYRTRELPDPENDANDTEALIRWLTNEKNVCIDIHFHPRIRILAAWNQAEHRFEYFHDDDWKQGVCELALKVISKNIADPGNPSI